MAMFVQIWDMKRPAAIIPQFASRRARPKILIDPFLSDNPSRDNGWSGCLTSKSSTQGGDR
jgi:hypothetical protein